MSQLSMKNSSIISAVLILCMLLLVNLKGLAQEINTQESSSNQIENFNVILKSGKVFIKWTCLPMDTDYSYFIERSENGIHFNQIGGKKGFKSEFSLFYSFIDPNPLAEVSYYKIKYVQADGSVTYSDAKQIVNKSFEDLPNSFATTASLN